MVESLSKRIASSLEVDRVSCYQKLLDRIRDLAWIMDTAGRIHLGNNSWQNYTGVRRSPSKTYFLWDLIEPEQKAKIQQLWLNCDRESDVWEHQLRLKNLAGNYTLFNLEIERLTAADKVADELAREYGLASGDQNYKQKELNLIRNAEFIRRILESSQDCIKVLDLQGRLLYMNGRGQDLMEIDNFAQVQYEPWLNFWQDCDRQAAQIAFATARAGGVGRFDGYCATAKGTPKWWEVVVTPMLGKDDRVQEILSVSRDLTARKIAEEALKERNQELDRFTYIVSHDLKAPLRGISNLSEMIVEDLQGQIPPDNQHQLNLLQQRVLRMNALIDGLLKYSRIGRQTLATESVDLGELLREIIDFLDPPKGFKITGILPLPTLVTKKLLLSQVLTNLIGNAIKHHDRDRGQIDLTVKDCGRYYQLAIADDGPGIPEADRERIFEMFETLKNKTSTTNTGIGLALVKKIVLGEGGELWLDSKGDRGCKFCFSWKK